MQSKAGRSISGVDRRQEMPRGGRAEDLQGRCGRRTGDGPREGSAREAPTPAGLLMAPPRGGGDQGGLVERPTRPKPVGGAGTASLN
jgi:hypothetical protein